MYTYQHPFEGAQRGGVELVGLCWAEVGFDLCCSIVGAASVILDRNTVGDKMEAHSEGVVDADLHWVVRVSEAGVNMLYG
jgi:hypothetical protein